MNEEALLKRLIELTEERISPFHKDERVLDVEGLDSSYFEAIAEYFKERGHLELAEAIETYCEKYVPYDDILCP